MREIIAVLGGTFDPIHNGHLQIALEVGEKLAASQIRLMPVGVPSHRSAPQLSQSRRIAALEAAISDVAAFSIDLREQRREGPSYSIRSLEELRAENPGASLCFVMGTDAWEHIGSWHRYSEILGLCHVIVVRRPGSELPAAGVAADLLAEHAATDAVQLAQRSAGYVLPLEVSQLEISATAIRQRLAAKLPINYLVPESVAEILQKTVNGM